MSFNLNDMASTQNKTKKTKCMEVFFNLNYMASTLNVHSWSVHLDNGCAKMFRVFKQCLIKRQDYEHGVAYREKLDALEVPKAPEKNLEPATV